MAYNLPPPDDIGGPGPGPGIGGFGIPGFGKSFNLDYGAGFGLPGGGFWGGGYPGWGTPYVPVTPLGSLWGFKGDLIVPIVAIGVALFILLLIVLAVKYALAWKIGVLENIAGGNGPFRREAGTAPAEHLEDSNLNRLADAVAAAVYSEGCSKRILCEIGAYAREGRQYPSLLRLMELVVPEQYHDSFVIVRDSAEGHFDCQQNYPCGDVGQKKTSSAADAANEINVGGPSHNNIITPPAATSNQTVPTTPATPHAPGDATPAPSIFGKFKRTIFDK